MCIRDRLADVQGRQRPCFFRAIDTENAAQLAALKRLVVAGDAELDLGEKAVVSSIVAENMGLNVGDVVRVYKMCIRDRYSAVQTPVAVLIFVWLPSAS